MKKAKIVSTLGPASSSEEMLEQLIAAGVDVFRLNFSHGTQDEHSELV
ncbi:MAG: pyruvate kinase, partial [Candidatus Latescibacterota bacterium]